MSKGFHTNIEKDSIKNNNFRKVIFTTKKLQLVLMSLLPQEDIGMERHDTDQFFRVEQGHGVVIINGHQFKVKEGSAVVVPSMAEHNFINTSRKHKLKLYTIYVPPQHKKGTQLKFKPASN